MRMKSAFETLNKIDIDLTPGHSSDSLLPISTNNFDDSDIKFHSFDSIEASMQEGSFDEISALDTQDNQSGCLSEVDAVVVKLRQSTAISKAPTTGLCFLFGRRAWVMVALLACLVACVGIFVGILTFYGHGTHSGITKPSEVLQIPSTKRIFPGSLAYLQVLP